MLQNIWLGLTLIIALGQIKIKKMGRGAHDFEDKVLCASPFSSSKDTEYITILLYKSVKVMVYNEQILTYEFHVNSFEK